MICPKCGAKLVSGTTVCPICGSRQRSAAPAGGMREKNASSARNAAAAGTKKKTVSQRSQYVEEEDYDDRYEDDYQQEQYDDDYEDERPRKSRGIFVGIILTCVVIMGVLIALIVMLLQEQDNQPYMPQTVNQDDISTAGGTTAVSEVTTEEEIEPSIEDQGEQLKVDGSIYEKTDEGLVLVEYSGNAAIVKLPAEIGGYPVVAIGSHAFKNSTGIQYIQLSENIKRLDTFSLYDLTELKEVFIPASVTEIRTYAFSRVKTCTTPEGSFASQHMLRIAEQVVIGNELSVQNVSQIPTVSTPVVQPTAPPPPATPAPTTEAPTTPAPTPTPTTEAPTTPTPTTEAPTTPAPETEPTTTLPEETEELTTEAETGTQPSAEPGTDEQPSVEPGTDTQPSAEPSTDTQPSEEPSTEEATTLEPTTPEPTTPTPTERNQESVQAAIAAAAQGTVISMSYGDFGTGDGNEVGFAIVQGANGYSCWYNDASGSYALKNFDPAVDSVSSAELQLGSGTHYVLIGGGTTVIYGKDAAVYAELPGELDVNAMTLNTASGTAYLTVSDGVLCEYDAVAVTKEEVENLTGGKKLLKDILTANGLADYSGATFLYRANDMIQINLSNGYHVDLRREDGSVTGSTALVAGHASTKYTSLQSITPGTLPTVLTSAVTLQGGTAGSYDVNGDGVDDQIVWNSVSEDGGVTNKVVITVNGAQVYKSTADITSATVEICDLNNSALGRNIVILGTGATGNFLEILDGNFNVVFRLDSSSSVLQWKGTFSNVSLEAGHLVFDADVEGDGVFKMNLESPIKGVSSEPYYVTVPFDSNSWSEKNGVTEYDIVQLTGSSVATLKETTQYANPNAAQAGSVNAAGTAITPKKLVVGTDGNIFIYTDLPTPGYILVDPSAEIPVYGK